MFSQNRSDVQEWFADPEIKPHAIKRPALKASGKITIIHHAGIEYLCDAVKGQINLSNTADGKEFKTLRGHSKHIYSVIQLTDNQLLSCASDNTIKLWDIPSGTCTKTYQCDENDSAIQLLKLTDETFLSVSHQGTLTHWSTRSLEARSSLSCNEKSYSQMRLQNGLVLIGLYDCIKVYDALQNKFVNEFKIHKRPTYALLELNDEYMLSGSIDNTIKLWEKCTGLCLSTWTGHTSMVTSLAKLNDGRILSASMDNTLKLWNQDGTCLKSMGGIFDPVVSLHLCHDGLIAGELLKGGFKMWDVGSRCRLRASTETNSIQSTQFVLSSLQATTVAATDAKDDEKFTPAPTTPLYVKTALIKPVPLRISDLKEAKLQLDDTEQHNQPAVAFK